MEMDLLEHYQQWHKEPNSAVPYLEKNQPLHEYVCQSANLLKAMGAQKGDTICFYLPKIPEMVVLMLACAKIGLTKIDLFGTFAVNTLQAKIQETNARMIITSDEGFYNGQIIPLKQIVDTALELPSSVLQVLVIGSASAPGPRHLLRDVDFHSLVSRQAKLCVTE